MLNDFVMDGVIRELTKHMPDAVKEEVGDQSWEYIAIIIGMVFDWEFRNEIHSFLDFMNMCNTHVRNPATVKIIKLSYDSEIQNV